MVQIGMRERELSIVPQKTLEEERRCPPEEIGVVEILQVLEGAAYVGFIAGAIFAVLQLREIGKDRRVGVVVNMYSTFISTDMTEAYSKIITEDFQSAADMEQKCSHASLAKIAGFYEGVGYLARKRLVDPKVVIELLPITVVWRKMMPWVMLDRERTAPSQWVEFEYLARMTEVYDAKSVYLAEINAAFDALKARK